ncbi:PREDICTED: GDSL [Prunus dulcis]|uniref:PREDICTED: GDSL n=1 Tax=Prunus dulcis TaxID=3755 RepID=A0A5E4ETW5_PRUDU|nr:PREDICTED: GDSL [Prunus dulcis]
MAGISSKENQPEAERFGVKDLLPAYLSPNLQLQELPTGVSFASGGSGYDPLTAKLMELYGLEARRIGVMSVAVIGCVPSQIHRGHWVGANREDAQSMPTMQLCFSTPNSPPKWTLSINCVQMLDLYLS